MTDVVIVLTTIPVGAGADELATALVAEHLAACVNVCSPMTSVYRWKGELERAGECQLVIKTTRDRVAALEARLKALHPYELPELLVLSVEEGSAAYLEWVRAETRGVQ